MLVALGRYYKLGELRVLHRLEQDGLLVLHDPVEGQLVTVKQCLSLPKAPIEITHEVAELLLRVIDVFVDGGGLLDDLEEVRGLPPVFETLPQVDVEGHLEEAGALQVERALALAVVEELEGSFAALQRENLEDVRLEGLADCISLLHRRGGFLDFDGGTGTIPR